jgi:hypothetical protein
MQGLFLTADELHLWLESQSEQHELVDGQPMPMAGATITHVTIVMNASVESQVVMPMIGVTLALADLYYDLRFDTELQRWRNPESIQKERRQRNGLPRQLRLWWQFVGEAVVQLPCITRQLYFSKRTCGVANF